MTKERYFDCATTVLDCKAVEEINKGLTDEFFNPSSPYSVCSGIKVKISRARQNVADVLKCDKDNIIFTSGGTESNNIAIFGGLNAKKGKIITSQVEHPCVLNCVLELQKRGFEVVYAPLNPNGSVSVGGFKQIVDESTVLVCLMHVNNETGAINDLKALCKVAKSRNPSCVFASDGVQAFCKVPTNLIDLNVDFYSVTAHKIHGPKGVGALYIKNPDKFVSRAFGGGQEKGLRPGTESVPMIYGFGKAVEVAVGLIGENEKKYSEFRQTILNCLNSHTDGFVQICVNDCASHILTLAFAGIKSQILLNLMEQNGFYIGSGSACHSKSPYSAAGQAIGLDVKYLEGMVRICFSRYNTAESVAELAEELVKAVQEVRKLIGKK